MEHCDNFQVNTLLYAVSLGNPKHNLTHHLIVNHKMLNPAALEDSELVGEEVVTDDVNTCILYDTKMYCKARNIHGIKISMHIADVSSTKF